MTSNITQFSPPYPLNAAVLFLVFNRLDTTKQVFEAIRQAKPPRLYVAADGARETKEGEDKKAQEVRDYIMSNIDWECEVKTLFQDDNLGCKMAVSGAIDWFFENEEMGIILEDDCLPSQSFFWFCEELLNRYKDDMRIWHIGGNNFGSDFKQKYSFSFIRFPQVWGWATWKSRWEFYDKDLVEFDNKFCSETDISGTLNISKIESKQLKIRFLNSKRGIINTWDYQWHATVKSNHGLCIYPTQNLISNLGDGMDATHTVNDTERTHLNIDELSTPLIYPTTYFINFKLEEWFKVKMGIKLNFISLLKSHLMSCLK